MERNDENKEMQVRHLASSWDLFMPRKFTSRWFAFHHAQNSHELSGEWMNVPSMTIKCSIPLKSKTRIDMLRVTSGSSRQKGFHSSLSHGVSLFVFLDGDLNTLYSSSCLCIEFLITVSMYIEGIKTSWCYGKICDSKLPPVVPRINVLPVKIGFAWLSDEHTPLLCLYCNI